MRAFLLLLVLANVAFLAWSLHFSPAAGPSPESHLLNQQIQPDAIKLLAPDTARDAPPAEAAPVASPAASTAAAPAAPAGPQVSAQATLPANAKPAATSPPPATVCLEWGAFSPADVRGVLDALAKVLPEAKVAQRGVVDEGGQYWVFMPPQPSRQVALQKVGELRRLGVEEMFIIQDDSKYRYAISLGVFRTQEAARNYLEKLRGQGVRTAQVGPRDTSAQRVFLQVRAPANVARAELGALRADHPGTDVRSCAAANGRT
jgi:hypothetical protein